jgi:hypothetical protein
MPVFKASRFADTCSRVIQKEQLGVITSTTSGDDRDWINSVTRSDNFPDWKARIASGRNCSTTQLGNQFHARGKFDRSTLRVDSSLAPANYSIYTASGELGTLVVDPSLFPLPGSSDIEKARTLAEIAFTKNFRNITRLWQSGVFAGELLQLAKMLANPAAALRTGVTQLHANLFRNTARAVRRRGKPRYLDRQVRDAVAGTYLEWEYGWKPTISDLDDAAKAFRAMSIGRSFDMIRIRGDGRYESAVNSRYSYFPGLGWPGDVTFYQGEKIDKYVSEVILRGAWRSDRADDQLPLPMMLGTTLGDILPTAWELVPWSFLLDYFTNIGDVLEVWGMRFIDFAWLNETVRLQTVQTRGPPPSHWVHTTGSLTRTFTGPYHSITGSRKFVSRYPYDNSWTPSLRGEIPGWGSRRWLNIAALASMRKVPSHLVR